MVGIRKSKPGGSRASIVPLAKSLIMTGVPVVALVVTVGVAEPLQTGTMDTAEVAPPAM